ncbi:MAG TPA: 16S rRNA (adenine(1518)-N(6)/adenine(1519)-N(6))-dimethyltransferase RsmA [Bryobacteraceae bacterium]|nr:16S rRNA (adenine(1518)-N(6)/adenine(1519)-N(6))-dimethyltransferase RsmA [Bryobacteraceae bacterium]
MGRRLGQHFLNRESILDRIACAACPEREPLVVEIGPGKGALTKHLLARSGKVVAIETDLTLVEHLAAKFSGAGNLTLVHADALETDLLQWGRAVFAGNLPYYVSSPILRRVLRLKGALVRCVFLVQKEVAERLVASPGSRSYGLLSVETALYARPELLFSVPASAFSPPPKVESALVRLTPHGEEPPEADDLLSFVARCFHQKRKTLRNNLPGPRERRMLENRPESSLRAEQLSLDQFQDLYQRLKSFP